MAVFDVDSDGLDDLILHFTVRDLDVELTDTQVELRGVTRSGQDIVGAADVTFVASEFDWRGRFNWSWSWGRRGHHRD
jgi:hypothetical protein